MGVQTQFNKFHDAIKLSKQDDVYKKAREKDDSITQDIKNAFKDANHPVIEDFIQGSFATDTAILKKNGDFDIDRAIVISYDDAPANPIPPKKIICDNVLEKRGFKNSKIKKPCVTADYTSESLHIDFPLYRKIDDSYELSIGKRNSDEANRRWESADPKGLKDWIKDKTSYWGSSVNKLNQFNRIVRYLKRWRDEKFSEEVGKKIYSIGITVMAKHCFSPSFDDDGRAEDLIAIKDTVSLMLSNGYFNDQGNDQYKVSVYLPVTPWRDIFDGSSTNTSTQFRNKLSNMKTKLDKAIAEDDEVKKCTILNEIFGDDFQIPEEKNTTTENNRRAIFSSSGAVGTSQGA